MLWNSQLIQEEEFQAALNSDFSFVIFSFLFVWFWMWVHVGSFAVASFSMLQILISLPLSMFIYSVVFQIGYFGAMQILVVFIILGIGADDVFVYSDAWLQSAEDVERDLGEARSAYLERRVAYAYARALEAILDAFIMKDQEDLYEEAWEEAEHEAASAASSAARADKLRLPRCSMGKGSLSLGD